MEMFCKIHCVRVNTHGGPSGEEDISVESPNMIIPWKGGQKWGRAFWTERQSTCKEAQT